MTLCRDYITAPTIESSYRSMSFWLPRNVDPNSGHFSESGSDLKTVGKCLAGNRAQAGSKSYNRLAVYFRAQKTR